MTAHLTRRTLITRASLAIGGVIALKALPGCSDDDGAATPQTSPLETSDAGADACPQCPAPNTCPDAAAPSCPDAAAPSCPDAAACECPDAEACADAAECPACPDAGTTGPTAMDFPYGQHLAPTYRLVPADVKELAYHYYYAGGCCHGAYRGLLEHMALTAGAPFNLLPLDLGKFGGGGIAGFGSICGAVLGGVMMINNIVGDAAVRTAMLTDLMRWYEGNPFPAYLPVAIDAAETGLTKDFSSGAIVNLQRAPMSHLCHASVSDWCLFQGVSAGSADKKARCARLTADVAGKVAEMLNSYFETNAYTVTPLDSASAACVGCHTGSSAAMPSVASGMICGSCHTDKTTGHP